MDLVNLQLARVVIHEVFRRDDDRQPKQPRYGVGLERLDQEARDVLRDRIVSAMASSPKCMEMAIEDAGAQSMVAIASSLVDADDALFVQRSRDVANKLVAAQTSRQLPGGIVVAFAGSAGVPARRIMGVIKAEVHNGFTRQEDQQGRLTLRFLKDLLLTPQTKLYKIGIFLEQAPANGQALPAGWRAFVYDELMTAANRYAAAAYFYGGFLGCKFPPSSALKTRQFYDLTKGFVRAMNVPEEDKLDLYNALVTYLKTDQSPTVEVNAFAMTYFADPEMQDAYAEFMTESGFPREAVAKDLTDVTKSLRTRRMTFRNNVKVIAPAEGFDNLLQIRLIAGDVDANGIVPQWTQVTVKDRIFNQE